MVQFPPHVVGGPAEVVLGRGVGGSGRGLGSVLKDWSAPIVTGCFFCFKKCIDCKICNMWAQAEVIVRAPQIVVLYKTLWQGAKVVAPKQIFLLSKLYLNSLFSGAIFCRAYFGSGLTKQKRPSDSVKVNKFYVFAILFNAVCSLHRVGWKSPGFYRMPGRRDSNY